jgi:hypothetical protein
MMKIKARIATDVEYTVEADNHDEAKRRLLERLAVDGYTNSTILNTVTNDVDTGFLDLDLDIGIDTSYSPPCFMFGKL